MERALLELLFRSLFTVAFGLLPPALIGFRTWLDGRLTGVPTAWFSAAIAHGE